jgi:hypothetical protein
MPLLEPSEGDCLVSLPDLLWICSVRTACGNVEQQQQHLTGRLTLGLGEHCASDREHVYAIELFHLRFVKEYQLLCFSKIPIE